MIREIETLLEQNAKMRSALLWYADEAKAIAQHMTEKYNEQALLASMTVLALDAGNRARQALAENLQGVKDYTSFWLLDQDDNLLQIVLYRSVGV